MISLGILLLIVILFYFLGRAADVVVTNVREVGKRLGIAVSFLGFLLGFFTSFPELSIAVNAGLSDVADLSVGNLIGGIPVLIGLVLGLNALFHRGVSTTVSPRPVFWMSCAMFLPLVLLIDGDLSVVDGLVLLVAYMSVVVAMFMAGKKRHGGLRLYWQADVTKPFFLIVASISVIAVLSNLIIRFTNELLTLFSAPPFLVGLLLFGIGTNLPEIIISFRAYEKSQEELSISNIIGSAMANVGILGLLALMSPFSHAVDVSYILLCVGFALLLGTFVATYRSGGKLTRLEGAVLVALYVLFVFGQSSSSLISTL